MWYSVLMKTCKRCKIEKPLTEFHPNKRTTSGVQSQCKDCHRITARESRVRVSKAPVHCAGYRLLDWYEYCPKCGQDLYEEPTS